MNGRLMDDRGLDRRRLLRAGVCFLGVSALSGLAREATAQTPPVIDMVRNPTTGVWSAPTHVGGTALTRADRYVLSQVGGRAAASGLPRNALSRIVGGVARGVLGRALVVGGLIGVAANELHNLATGERLFSYDGLLGLTYEQGTGTVTVLRPAFQSGESCSNATPLPRTWPEMVSGAYLDPTSGNPCRLRQVMVAEIHANSPISNSAYRPEGWLTGHTLNITPTPPATYAQRVWWYTYGTASGPRIQLPGIPVTQLHETLSEDERVKDSNKEVALDVSNALQNLYTPTADLPTVPKTPWLPEVPIPRVGDWIAPRPQLFAPDLDPIVNWPGMPEEGEPGTDPGADPGTGTGTTTTVKLDTSGEPDLSPDQPPELPTVADWLNPLKGPLDGFLVPNADVMGGACQPLGTVDLAATFQIGSDPQLLDICPVLLDPQAVGFVDLVSTIGPPVAAAAIVLKS